MKALVTCGPTYEPIDSVRRITNFATGEIGTLLSDALDEAGFRVICLRSETATFPVAPSHAELEAFSTTADLRERLLARAADREISCVLHAAAVSDFIVDRAGLVSEKKIPSSTSEITLRLVAAPKILGELRPAFPGSVLVGWKYELDGSPADALAKGAAQIREYRTDACVVNGSAYGPGFGLLTADGHLEHIAGKLALARRLAAWLRERISKP